MGVRALSNKMDPMCLSCITNKGRRLQAAAKDGTNLRAMECEFQGDREVVLAAVQQNGGALPYASSELQRDRDLVLAAVRQNGGALCYTSSEFKRDREVV